MKPLVAFLFHAPGLRLWYGQRLTRALFIQNVIALGVTAAAAATCAATLSGNARWWGALVAWSAGHFAWGTYLAFRVR